ncbi:Ribonuclease P protein subunit p21 [Bagarius yarrelli]|uniref:Ribonuclease P protein subunit p21 n=1 Tax=Bagarius yarrelli TaxID=175774 RepID=A0A556TS99_BAGYA|nr:Ribonuclease P protein subunit p21 [Bagarius yarrelli]
MAYNIKDKEAFQRLNFLYQVKGPRRQRATIIRCLGCGETKKFPNNPKHQLWVDRPEAQLENQLQPEVSQSSKVLHPKDKRDKLEKSSTVTPVTESAASSV